MSIMQQSSKAQDRTLGVWFQNIQLKTLATRRLWHCRQESEAAKWTRRMLDE